VSGCRVSRLLHANAIMQKADGGPFGVTAFARAEHGPVAIAIGRDQLAALVTRGKTVAFRYCWRCFAFFQPGECAAMYSLAQVSKVMAPVGALAAFSACRTVKGSCPAARRSRASCAF
jgi:hypothetical protein